jgi:hypothetical protein
LELRVSLSTEALLFRAVRQLHLWQNPGMAFASLARRVVRRRAGSPSAMRASRRQALLAGRVTRRSGGRFVGNHP